MCGCDVATGVCVWGVGVCGCAPGMPGTAMAVANPYMGMHAWPAAASAITPNDCPSN